MRAEAFAVGNGNAIPRRLAREAILLGDIGATNVRFAVLRSGKLGAISTFAAADFTGIVAALRAFIDRRPTGLKLKQIMLGVAGPVHEGRSILTNSAWQIDTAQLREEFEVERVELMNDFAAIAWSLRYLGRADLLQIGSGASCYYKPAVVLGPGTGLGLACLVAHGNAGIVLETEAGHVTLPSTTLREDTIIRHLRERFGHVSAERTLSGDGLINLYQAIATLDGIDAPARTAEQITAAALAESCPLSQATLDMFCAMLGTFAGNAALTFGARGGIYVAGGIVPHIQDYLASSLFRERFEAKGRFRAYLSTIPTYIITHKDPAFLGLKALAEKDR
jgi:glucokinase